MPTANVSTLQDFTDAVLDMSIDTIILNADIELQSGISIPANKNSLIIDGSFNQTIHTLTDVPGNTAGETLSVQAGSSIELTFQNLNITGINFYGIPHVSGSGTENVIVNYINVTYIGPQVLINTQGLTHFENTDITITPSDQCEANEVGEVCRVEFKGNNVIRHNDVTDTTKAVFWFHQSNASFTIFENSELTAETVNYFMYCENVGVRVAYNIMEGAKFVLNANKGIPQNGLHYASTFLVDKNAEFRFIQSSSNLVSSSLVITEGFTVNEGAVVYMQANYANAHPLIEFATGYSIPFGVNSPKSFVLYNSSSNSVGHTLGSASFSITAEQLNHWTSATPFPDAGNIDDVAPNNWSNTDWTEFTVSGTYSTLGTSITSSGLINPPIPITIFAFANARVISTGNIPITVDPIIDNGRAITGTTEPYANLKISLNVGGGDLVFENITADEFGRFEVDPAVIIPAGTDVTIKVNTPFLIKEFIQTSVETGELSLISAPSEIEFTSIPISLDPVLLSRLVPIVEIEIEDTRAYKTEWELAVYISGPLTAVGSEVLENAVVYKDGGTIWDVGSTPLVIATGMYDDTIEWTEEDGIFVRPTGPIRSGARYTTDLLWSLTAVDEP